MNIQLKSKLEQEKESLEEELKNVARKDSEIEGNYEAKFPNIGRSDDENAQEVTEYEQNLSQEHQLEKNLADVNIALEKINKNDGSYGKCEKCGKEISEERLNAFPAARTCIECAE